MPTLEPVPRLLVACRYLSTACAAVTAFVGIAALVGWQVDASFPLSPVGMNPLTAVCFLAASFGVLLPRENRLLEVAVSGFIISCACARLLDLLIGDRLELDTVLFASRLEGNRMAPNTALGFLFLGLALWSRRTQTAIERSQALALAAGLIGYVVAIGYAYNLTSLVQVSDYVPMALHTALCFLLMATAALCAHPDEGIVSQALRESVGGQMVRRSLPFFWTVLPILGWLRLQGELAGLYSASFGVALSMGGTIALGVVLTWMNGIAIDRANTERQGRLEAIERMAFYDALTSLPSRVLFSDRLKRALARMDRSANHLVLMFLDLDGFKKVNDSLGHGAGDEVLRQVAARLLISVRATDTVARLSGDEFAIILGDIENLTEIDMIADRIMTNIGRPLTIEDGQEPVTIGVSIGATVAPTESRDPSLLLRQADAAMYVSKHSGKNRFSWYQPG